MDSQGRGLSESVWTSLDRKAGAVIELTVRQLRNKISTWVVMALGALLMTLLLVFYIDAIRDGFESIDNDGDSFDEDNDGYPMGQERKYGTSDWDGESFPGSGNFIFEGQIDWNNKYQYNYFQWNTSFDRFSINYILSINPKEIVPRFQRENTSIDYGISHKIMFIFNY